MRKVVAHPPYVMGRGGADMDSMRADGVRLSLLFEVPRCGACTTTVARLKLGNPPIGAASLSTR